MPRNRLISWIGRVAWLSLTDDPLAGLLTDLLQIIPHCSRELERAVAPVSLRARSTQAIEQDPESRDRSTSFPLTGFPDSSGVTAGALLLLGKRKVCRNDRDRDSPTRDAVAFRLMYSGMFGMRPRAPCYLLPPSMFGSSSEDNTAFPRATGNDRTFSNCRMSHDQSSSKVA